MKPTLSNQPAFFELPLSAYQFGNSYEIRDERNKIIMNLSGSIGVDHIEKKQWTELLPLIAKLINDHFTSENGSNGDGVIESDKISETVGNSIISDGNSIIQNEIKERKRGNPNFAKGKKNPYK